MKAARRVVSGSLVAVAATLSLGGTCRAQFRAGDVYLVSGTLPDPSNNNTCGPGILRIQPSGQWPTTIIAHLPTTVLGRGWYDTFRARLLVPYMDSTVETVDSNGTRTPLPYMGSDTALYLAPTGDGRIY